MKQNKTILLLILFSLSLFLTECRKGENDPLISLRSRKARVAGDWIMKSGTDKSSYTSGTTGTTSTYSSTYTETSYTEVTTFSGGGSASSSGSHKVTFEIEKDGSFIYTETTDGYTGIAKGTWNFTGGIGESKNKEQLVLHVTSYSDPDESGTVTGNITDVTYDIKELRNKKLVLTSQYRSSNSGGDVDSNETEFIFEQQ